MRRWAVWALAGLLGAVACDQGPSGPGAITGRVVSPNGAEGAAVMLLTGQQLGAVSSAGSTRAFSHQNGAQLRVVLVNVTPGELRFKVEVPDVGAPPPAATVLQVVDGENALRPVLTGYKVEFSR
ncbi:MAG: hypothetical protein HY704_00430 [Gemmatimonadetes bacterium]|nr:hypothetical protein [Gemmatimonadota bacterium]